VANKRRQVEYSTHFSDLRKGHILEDQDSCHLLEIDVPLIAFQTSVNRATTSLSIMLGMLYPFGILLNIVAVLFFVLVIMK
jgi:hypothetical protein